MPLTFSVCNNTKLYKSLQRDFYIWQKCNQNEEVVWNIPVISNAIFKKYVFLSRVPVRDLFVVMVETFKELSEFWHLKSWIFYRTTVTCSIVLFLSYRESHSNCKQNIIFSPRSRWAEYWQDQKSVINNKYLDKFWTGIHIDTISYQHALDMLWYGPRGGGGEGWLRNEHILLITSKW